MPQPSPHKNPEKSSVDTGTELRHLLLPLLAEVLTSHQYQVFVLCFLEGMPQKEIARELNISPSAVSRCCSAAMRRIRKALGYTYDEMEAQDMVDW